MDELGNLIKKMVKESPERTVKAMNETANVIRNQAALKATNINRKSGLAKSIHIDNATLGKMEALVYSNHIAAKFNEFGTSTRSEFPSPAYNIFPVKKKALFWKGLPYPIGAVKNHPGIPARPCMRPAGIYGLGKVVEIFTRFFHGI
jgi:hypothetical protein